MEGIFFILIGAALFSQSWYILGLYSEGRIMGVFTGSLGVLVLGIVMFGASLEPTLLTGDSRLSGADRAATMLADLTVLKGLMLIWAAYAIGVGAHGLWEFEDRAIGLYSGFLAIASVIAFLYFAIELESVYSDAGWLSMSGAALALAVLSTITFFYLALQLSVLRLVAGWFILLGGSVVVAVGLAMLSTAIT